MTKQATNQPTTQPNLPAHLRSTMPEDTRRQLEARLLSLGGDRAVFYGPEPHADALLERGRLFPNPVKFHRGQPSQCHANSARLWEKAPTKYRIATGYALSDDGIWRPHSWVHRDGILFETTLPRDRYFGVELDDLEAVEFWAENCLISAYLKGNPPPSYCKKRRSAFKLLDKLRENLIGRSHERIAV